MKRPHQAKRVAAFMVAQMRVGRASGARKSWRGEGLDWRSLLEELGFVDAAADPEGEEGGEDAGEEDGAPSETREDDGSEGGA